MMSSVRDVEEADFAALIEVGNASGLFTPDELDQLLSQTLTSLFNGTLDKSHVVRTLVQENEPIGWTYFGPSDEETEGEDWVFELFWIGVSPTAQRRGAGSTLLEDCENTCRALGASKLLIATSSAEGTAKARSFYVAKGYTRSEKVVENFYSPGEDKITFTKML